MPVSPEFSIQERAPRSSLGSTPAPGLGGNIGRTWAGTWQPPAEVQPRGPGGRQGPSAGADEAPPWGRPACGSAASGLGRSQAQCRPQRSSSPWRASGQLGGCTRRPVRWLRQGLPSAKHSCCARGWESQVHGEPARGPGGSWSQQQGGGCCRAQGVGPEPQLLLACLCWAPSLPRLSTQNQGEGSGQWPGQAASPHTPAWARLWSPGSGARLRCPGGRGHGQVSVCR